MCDEVYKGHCKHIMMQETEGTSWIKMESENFLRTLWTKDEKRPFFLNSKLCPFKDID